MVEISTFFSRSNVLGENEETSLQFIDIALAATADESSAVIITASKTFWETLAAAHRYSHGVVVVECLQSAHTTANVYEGSTPTCKGITD